MNWNELLCEKRRRTSSTSAIADESRNEFQRDYHRIIGSASFRRLQDKTQVFPLDRGDFVRTRLTHSLEVASFAKSLGQMIFRTVMENGIDKDITADRIVKICSILECSGLIHDIGNPPFGHFGEDLIRDWFRKKLPDMTFGGRKVTNILTREMAADLCNFEGNAQAFRLLTKLHFIVDGNGMNLTYPLLNTIIKYPVPSTGIDRESGDIRQKKMGYYQADKDIFEDVTSSTGAYSHRHPLAFILEAADDIAYKTADIEDAVKKGFITYKVLVDELRSNYAEKCRTDAEKETIIQTVERLEGYCAQALENAVSSPEQNAVQRCMIYVQGILLDCAQTSFTANYSKIMNGTFKKELLAVSRGCILADALSDMADRFVFRSKTIYKLEIAAEAIYSFLLEKLTRAAVLYDTDLPRSNIDMRIMELVSDNYIRAYSTCSEGCDEAERLYLRLLLVTDFICGMTDGYAKKLYRELNGID